MKLNKRQELIITLTIVALSFVIRVIRLDIPHEFSFDEVYHALSAEAYALNDPRGYEWWNSSPKDLAWEWLHPPLGKLFMAASIKIFAKPYIPESKSAPLDGATTFAWRFPGTIFAALTVLLLIRFGTKLFNNYWIGTVAGSLYALDGLSFVQSRTGMNDIYVTFFVVLTFYRLFIFMSEYPRQKVKNAFWIAVAAGLAAATKWTGFYVVGIAWMLTLAFTLKRRDGKLFFPALVLLTLIPPLIYVLSYGQWWFQGHTIKQFYELHQQIWWYQTGLKATHDYQSKALTWPILYRPVWFYVKYQDVVKNGVKELYIGNIYTMGNPLVWWAGLVAVIFGLWKMIVGIWHKIEETVDEQADKPLAISLLLVGYFGMFLPWVFSPRIMFLYHYLPSVPFLCLLLAYSLYQIKSRYLYGGYFVTAYLALVVLLFIYFYPQWTALPLPQKWVDSYYWFKSWK